MRLNTSLITRFAHHNSVDQPESTIQNIKFSKSKREMAIEDISSNEYAGIRHTSLSRVHSTIDFFSVKLRYFQNCFISKHIATVPFKKYK